MSTLSSYIRWGHPIMLTLVILFAIIELCIASWLTARYNSRHNFHTSGQRARVRYILFCSIWTIAIGVPYLIGFILAPYSIFAGVLSHVIFYFMTWAFWTAAAAAITQTLGGGLGCAFQDVFVYCGQLNALEGFAWLIWIFLTFMISWVIVRAITVAKRGEGIKGSLLED